MCLGEDGETHGYGAGKGERHNNMGTGRSAEEGENRLDAQT
eukprot:CAMPEP_0177618238 /NCGR_PEP_ID=MMETSP0419_2-20121207/25437_1 /TAXON_ID=582737 /ORGANISM="Tetraselmis sp., Strain GSL018" /LENGTH=40 /DNA_ID= /DNA_START= /DNA_END= /DNA_ORIENTATION=